ncbi:MAG: acyl-CoA dehydrogenase family protein [Bryobacterales bacterium]
MCKRACSNVAFGKPWPNMARSARTSPSRASRSTRRACSWLRAAHMMDTVGNNKAARSEIAQIKVVAPNVALAVLDRAIQAHGGGICDDFFLAAAWANQRTLRLADGPDEVHLEAIAKLELRKNPV